MIIVRGRGIIVPSEWDAEGNVVSVGIATRDEHEYVVDEDAKGQELKTLIRNEVEFVGRLRKIGEKQFIAVEKYKIRRDLT